MGNVVTAFAKAQTFSKYLSDEWEYGKIIFTCYVNPYYKGAFKNKTKYMMRYEHNPWKTVTKLFEKLNTDPDGTPGHSICNFKDVTNINYVNNYLAAANLFGPVIDCHNSGRAGLLDNTVYFIKFFTPMAPAYQYYNYVGADNMLKYAKADYIEGNRFPFYGTTRLGLPEPKIYNNIILYREENNKWVLEFDGIADEFFKEYKITAHNYSGVEDYRIIETSYEPQNRTLYGLCKSYVPAADMSDMLEGITDKSRTNFNRAAYIQKFNNENKTAHFDIFNGDNAYYYYYTWYPTSGQRYGWGNVWEEWPRWNGHQAFYVNPDYYTDTWDTPLIFTPSTWNMQGKSNDYPDDPTRLDYAYYSYDPRNDERGTICWDVEYQTNPYNLTKYENELINNMVEQSSDYYKSYWKTWNLIADNQGHDGYDYGNRWHYGGSGPYADSHGSSTIPANRIYKSSDEIYYIIGSTVYRYSDGGKPPLN